MALWVLLTEGGKLVVIRWRPFPHFGVRPSAPHHLRRTHA